MTKTEFVTSLFEEYSDLISQKTDKPHPIIDQIKKLDYNYEFCGSKIWQITSDSDIVEFMLEEHKNTFELYYVDSWASI